MWSPITQVTLKLLSSLESNAPFDLVNWNKECYNESSLLWSGILNVMDQKIPPKWSDKLLGVEYLWRLRDNTI